MIKKRRCWACESLDIFVEESGIVSNDLSAKIVAYFSLIITPNSEFKTDLFGLENGY